MTRYRNNPRWLMAKWPGHCAESDAPIKAGERAFYYPRERTLYSGECAEQAARDFECAAADEQTWSGFYPTG
jgi:hypothetical protein